MSAPFNLPSLIDHSGWGPVPAALSTSESKSNVNVSSYAPVPAGAFMFAELPFQPFNKNEKLWRVSDWTSKEGENGKWPARPNFHAKDTTGALGIIGDDGVPLEDGDGSFSLVDNRPKLKPRYGKTTFKRGMMGGGGSSAPNAVRRGGARGGSTSSQGYGQRNQQSQYGQRNQRNAGQVGRGGRGGARGRGGRGGRGGMSRSNMFDQRSAAELREPSVRVDEEWPLVQDIDMSNLGNFIADVDEGEDLTFAGSLELVNPKMAHITPRNPANLARYENRQHFTATTSADPIIEELKKESTGNVYATDVILSALMASPRSVNSWDILIRREGDNIYLDKRPSSRLDYISVNENNSKIFDEASLGSLEKDNINHPDNLSLEATLINHNYAQQLLSTPAGAEKTLPHTFDRENPFLAHLARGNEPASIAFRYRKWKLPGGIQLVARCSLNGFIERKPTAAPKPVAEDDEEAEEAEEPAEGSKSYVLARAINEFDSKLQGNVDWRQKLESQTGSVLANEIKNNHYKLSRWISETILSGCDELKIGFVSRVNPRQNTKHVILMSKTFTPQTFADSVNVQTRKLWGTLAQLLAQIKKLDQGSYLMMRDPQKNVLHIYSVPADAFDHELEDLDE